MMCLERKQAVRRWLASSLALVLLLPAVAANAQERSITEIEPAVIQQGDTVLLTIKGENLPVGTVALDFFPQQIAVLDILSASDSEVVAQIKVPSLVAPGAYNVVLYNHLGDEAFGEGLLTIASDVITPIFREYDPKVIAEATEGFALLLTGESITEQAAAHLKMRWYQGERELTRLSTMFSTGGPGQVVCAVTGDLPGGKLQGKVYLDDKPIYLVEITIESPTGIIVGHSPAQVDLAAVPYELTLIGTDLTQDYISLLNVEMSSADTVAKAQEVTLRDAATVTATFNGPLPAGVYDLQANRLDEVVYTGQVDLVAQPAPPEIEPKAPEPPEVEGPPIERPQPGADGEPPGVPPVELRIDSVAPLSVPADAKAVSLVINGSGLGATLAERLQLRLNFNQVDCELLFMGATRQNLTCLFAPPDGGWPVGETGTLTITDPAGKLEEYVAELVVTRAQEAGQPVGKLPGAEESLPAPSSEPAAPRTAPVAWRTERATVVDRNGTSTLSVALTADDQGWDPKMLAGSFNLLPDDPLLPQVFSNVTLAGELSFNRTAALTAEATCAGHFVPGDLLVEIRYADGTESASMLRLPTAAPAGVATAPSIPTVEVDAVSGRMTPEAINWQVDFAPLEISEPNFINFDFSPSPTAPEEAISLHAEGTRIAIELHPQAWRNAATPGQKLSVHLSATIHLELSGDTALEISFVGSSMLAEGGVIRLAGDEATISDAGFEIPLVASDPEITAEILENVRLETSNLLLSLNSSEFAVQAEPAPELGRDIVLLRFNRNATTLPDISYGLLVDELLEAEKVELSLSWVELGMQLSGSVRFVKPAAEARSDENDEGAGSNGVQP